MNLRRIRPVAGQRKNETLLRRPAVEVLEPRQLLSVSAPAAVVGPMATSATIQFSDSFTPSASSKWNNYSGNWVASNGTYAASVPENEPFAISSLPYDLTDLTVNVTVNNLADGGIWLHSDGTNQNGVILVLGGEGYGQGHRGGAAGNAIYWQVVNNGQGYVGGVQDEVDGVFTPGNTYNIKVTVTGDTYSAYINGASTPVTTFTDSTFASGDVGLYDDQPNVGSGGSACRPRSAISP